MELTKKHQTIAGVRLSPIASAVALALVSITQAASAQQAVATSTVDETQTVVVSGMRDLSRSSVAVKRNAEVIVDGLVSEEIGALPDLSVGETLDRIPGVTGSRFHGAIDEVAVRGLGPFLGYSTFNGRQLTNGSGDRAVGYQLFPSELLTKVLVYKTQQADFLEGGVSALVDVGTVRPLGYKGPEVTLDYRRGFQPKGENVVGQEGNVDKFSVSLIKKLSSNLGIAIGFARTDGAFPEDVYNANGSWQTCNSINTTPTLLTGSPATSNCSYSAVSGAPYYFATNSYAWRQVPTSDVRDALMGVVQFKPSDRTEVNFDFQLAQRTSIEDRHEFRLSDGRRGINPLVIAPNGALLQWQGNSTLESTNQERTRQEDYYGGGIKIDWRATDRLRLSADFDFSDTKRDQTDIGGRLRTAARYAYTMDQRFGLPSLTFATATPVNINDHSLFTSSAQATRELLANRDNQTGARLDGKYEVEWGPITQLSAGLRLARRQVVIDDSNQNVPATIAAANVTAGRNNCAVSFLQSDWGQGSGTNLTSWAEFNSRCLYTAFTGVADAGPAIETRSAGDVDATEKTKAIYLMANFETTVGRLPIEGNFGVRAIETRVTSLGFRTAYTTAPVVPSGIRLVPITGQFENVLITDKFVDVLPSLNLTVGLRSDLKLRAGLSKSIARPNFENVGAGRTVTLDANGVNVPDAIAGISGGNPKTKPMSSLNADLALDWYAAKDFSVFGAIFYKEFKAAAVGALVNEQFVVDGTSYTVPVALMVNSDKTESLLGIELSAQHALVDLPSPFNRLGYVVGLNYNDANVEFADPTAFNPAAPIANFTAPAGLNGSSRFAGSLMAYYDHAGLAVRVIYKNRTPWFKPTAAGVTANRYNDDQSSLDMSIDYKVNANLTARFQAINLLDTSSPTYRPVVGSMSDHTIFGRSYFFGAKYSF